MSKQKPLKVAVIGLGHQAQEDHLPALAESPEFDLVAVCDCDREVLDSVSVQYQVPGYLSCEELLSNHQDLDVAVLVLPHHLYLPTIRQLAERGVHVIKEKPFAVSMAEAAELQTLMTKYGIYIGVTMQRRFNPIFTTFKQFARRIGVPFSVEARYTFNIARLDEGWRAKQELAGGGALIDMGYHLVDLLVWYFGLPDNVTARLSYRNRIGQDYDVEDTAAMIFDYNLNGSHHSKMVLTTLISRIYTEKAESLRVIGTQGSIRVERGRIQLFDAGGELVDELIRTGAWTTAALMQMEYFADQIRANDPVNPPVHHEHLLQVAIIESAYRSDREEGSVSPAAILAEAGIDVESFDFEPIIF